MGAPLLPDGWDERDWRVPDSSVPNTPFTGDELAASLAATWRHYVGQQRWRQAAQLVRHIRSMQSGLLRTVHDVPVPA